MGYLQKMVLRMTAADLIAHRQSIGLSITAMAEALATPRGTYIKWERGERRVPGIVEVAIKYLSQENHKNNNKGF